jgi:chromosome segregation ATPase
VKEDEISNVQAERDGKCQALYDEITKLTRTSTMARAQLRDAEERAVSLAKQVKKMKIELASLSEYKNQMEIEVHNNKQVW